MAKLKLFKLTSGFHDSYVAATSRPAALKAWGARTDLFAMGAAEQIDDDPATLAEVSRKPGAVLQRRRTRGGKFETRAPRKRAIPDLAKLRRARETATRKLARAEAARDVELKRIDSQIERMNAKREGCEAKHDQLIKMLKEDLRKVEEKIDR